MSREAQQRLYHRYRQLTGRGKPHQHVVTAIGRELTGFLWAALLTPCADRSNVERRILETSMR
jgi:hypothetical protein